MSVNNSSDQISLPLPSRKRQIGSIGARGRLHVVAGLFAGIGGLERGLNRAGHRTSLLCENDPPAMAVLNTHFASISFHDDVRTLADLPDEISMIAAGFPCQDLSQAGKTAGIGGVRSGLVGEVFRLIKQHHTPWILLENVPFMLQLGHGRAMSVIATAFEELGYRWAYRVVDARAFGLPQRRRRVYFVASLEDDPRTVLFADETGVPAPRIAKDVACGFYWTEGVRGLGWAVDAVPTLKGGSTVGIPSPPAILLPSGAVTVVTPHICDAERLQGFPVDWTEAAQNVAKGGSRWKLVGNAVSVPAAEWIGGRFAAPGVVLEFPESLLRDHVSWPTAAWNVDGVRVQVDASEWPVNHRYEPLQGFLKYPSAPLSAKATAGFLERARRGRLRFPEGFLPALESHLLLMRGQTNTLIDRHRCSESRGDYVAAL